MRAPASRRTGGTASIAPSSLRTVRMSQTSKPLDAACPSMVSTKSRSARAAASSTAVLPPPLGAEKTVNLSWKFMLISEKHRKLDKRSVCRTHLVSRPMPFSPLLEERPTPPPGFSLDPHLREYEKPLWTVRRTVLRERRERSHDTPPSTVFPIPPIAPLRATGADPGGEHLYGFKRDGLRGSVGAASLVCVHDAYCMMNATRCPLPREIPPSARG